MEDLKKFYETLSDCTKIFQLFGLQLFPIDSSFENGFKRGSKIPRRHQILFILANLVVMVQASGTFFMTGSLFFEEHLNNNFARALIVQCGSYIGIAIEMTTILLSAYFKREKLMEVFRNFEKVYRIFTIELTANINFEDFRKRFKSTLEKLLLLYVTATLVVLSFIFYHDQSRVFIWAIFSVVSDFLFMMMIVQLSFLVLLLQENFSFMKQQLEKLYDFHEFSKINRNIISTVNENSRGVEMFEKVSKFKKIYSILHDTSKLVNDFFSLSILVFLPNFFAANLSATNKVRW